MSAMVTFWRGWEGGKCLGAYVRGKANSRRSVTDGGGGGDGVPGGRTGRRAGMRRS